MCTQHHSKYFIYQSKIFPNKSIISLYINNSLYCKTESAKSPSQKHFLVDSFHTFFFARRFSISEKRGDIVREYLHA